MLILISLRDIWFRWADKADLFVFGWTGRWVSGVALFAFCLVRIVVSVTRRRLIAPGRDDEPRWHS